MGKRVKVKGETVKPIQVLGYNHGIGTTTQGLVTDYKKA